VTSARKIEANRANARKSTGPKSATGKARSARNALRHGLSLSVSTDPKWAKQIDALTQLIAGCDARLDVQKLARRVAVAQIDVVRVRRAQHQLFAGNVNDPDCEPMALKREKMRQIGKLLRRDFLIPVPDEEMKFLATKPVAAEKAAAILSDHRKQFRALQRYECRTRSRRRRAIREFDCAQSSVPSERLG
jgi:hypothetical protein